MKKIITILLLSTVILTGCGSIDYKDPMVYLDVVNDKLDSTDQELRETLSQLVEVTGAQESYKKFMEANKKGINIYLETFSDETDRIYNDFKENINDLEIKIENPSEQIKKVIDTYNKSDQKAQEVITKAVNKFFDFYTNVMNEINKAIDGMPKEQLRILKDYDEMMENYIETNKLNLVDEIKKIINDK